MTDMQRYIADDDWLVLIDGRSVTTPVPGEVVVVLASDAEAAIAAVTSAAVAQIMGEMEDTRRDLATAFVMGQRDALAGRRQEIADARNDGYRQGWHEALANAMQRVEALPLTTRLAYNRSEVLAALRALGGSDE
jgi:hypothetical protein